MSAERCATADFTVAKLQLMHERVHLPPEVGDVDALATGDLGHHVARTLTDQVTS